MWLGCGEVGGQLYKQGELQLIWTSEFDPARRKLNCQFLKCSIVHLPVFSSLTDELDRFVVNSQAVDLLLSAQSRVSLERHFNIMI